MQIQNHPPKEPQNESAIDKGSVSAFAVGKLIPKDITFRLHFGLSHCFLNANGKSWTLPASIDLVSIDVNSIGFEF